MIINYRDKILYVIYGIICIAFVLSYAITNIAIVLLLILFFIDKKDALYRKLRYIKNNKLVWLYFTFFLIQLIGLIYSENMDEGLRRITVLLPLSFLPPLVIAEQKNRRYFDQLLNFLQLCIPFIFIALIQVHLIYDQRAISTFVHFTIEEKLGVSQFYLVFILMIPLLVSYKKVASKTNVIINGIIFLITIGLILILGNKTTIILLFILTLLFFAKNYKNIKALFMGIIVIGTLIFASINTPIVNERFATLFKTMDFDMRIIITKNSFTVTKNTLEHRALINFLSYEKIIDALPFGVGTGDVQDILKEEYKAVNFKAGLLNNFNSHNQYFYEFFKTGILGGILFMALLFVLNREALKSNYIALTLTIFFTLACLIESYLYRQHGVIIFTFLIPLFLTHKNELKYESKTV